MSEPGAHGGQNFPAVSWPSDAYAVKQRSIRYNGEAIDIIHLPNAYSDGDSLVYFRRSDVVVTGEILLDQAVSARGSRAGRHGQRGA